MSSHDVNLGDWLATPEGPPERIWQAALRLTAPEEDHAQDHADEVAHDHPDEVAHDQSLDEAVGDCAVEDGDLGLADAEPHIADAGAPMPYDGEDFDGDPFS